MPDSQVKTGGSKVPKSLGSKSTKKAQANLVNEDEKSPVVLLLIDVINELDFPHNEHMLKEAESVGPAIAALKERVVKKGLPVIYANDNYGKWRSDFKGIVQQVTEGDSPGKALSTMLRPTPDDYALMKPKHSAFYGTTLLTLLQHFGTKTIILCGFAGDVCVLFTANDAYMNDFSIVVPQDTYGCSSMEGRKATQQILHEVLKVDPIKSTEVDLDGLVGIQEELRKEDGWKDTPP